MRGQQSFFEAPIGVILRDGHQPGAIPPEFIVALFDYEFPRNSEPTLSRLDLEADRAGRRPTPYQHGPTDDIPFPGFRNDYVVLNRAQRNMIYGPGSIGTRDKGDLTDSPHPARLAPRAPEVPHLPHRFDHSYGSRPSAQRPTSDSRKHPQLHLEPHAEKRPRPSEPSTAPEPPPKPQSATSKSIPRYV